VALKFCTNEVAARNLRKELELLDRVRSHGRHLGIVELIYAHLEGETPCLEYEFVDGGDLGGLIAELHAAGGLVPEASAKLMLQLARAVGFAHQLAPAIVHRDLKPANVLTARTNRAVRLKVADFGIGGISVDHAIGAWSGAGHPGPLGAASTASVGSCAPLYASPQQRALGRPTPRDDIYSLGVIWFQMLTGDMSKEAPRGGAWKKRLRDCGASAELVALLERCVEDDPNERPADGNVLAEELQALIAPAPVPPPVPPSVERWYYVREGKQLGPVSFAELQRLAVTDALARVDKVWTEGYKVWVEAGSVDGLCPPLGSVPPPVPDAQNRVTGTIEVSRQFTGGLMWYRITFDGTVLGESRLMKGGRFEFESTTGEHQLEVEHTGALLMTKLRTFTVSFPKPGTYLIEVKPTQGFLGTNPGFAIGRVTRTGDTRA
jgi:hypothetical protein